MSLSATVTFRTNPEMKAAIIEMERRTGIPASEFYRRSMIAYMAKFNPRRLLPEMDSDWAEAQVQEILGG